MVLSTVDMVNHLYMVETGHIWTPSMCLCPLASSFPGLWKLVWPKSCCCKLNHTAAWRVWGHVTFLNLTLTNCFCLTACYSHGVRPIVGCWTMQYVSKMLDRMKSYQYLLCILSSLVLCWSDSQCMLLPRVPKEWQEEIWVSYTLCVVYDKHVCSGMYIYMYAYVYIFCPWFNPARLSWRKLTLPSNTSNMVTQPHSLLATKTTWTTQIACLTL